MLVVIVVFHHNCKKAHTRTTKNNLHNGRQQKKKWLCHQEENPSQDNRRQCKESPTEHQEFSKQKKEISQTKTVSELKKLNLMKLETIDALPHTKKHEAHILKVVNSFITVLSSDAQNI